MSGIINTIFKGKDDKNAPKVSAPATTQAESASVPKAVKPAVVKNPVATTEEKSEAGQASNPDTKTAKRIDNDIYKVLSGPVVTEKASAESTNNKYPFAVPVSANKSEVAKKIANLYGIKPLGVNMVKVHGKKVRRGRTFGQQKSWKKAIVTLAAGDKIQIYEGV